MVPAPCTCCGFYVALGKDTDSDGIGELNNDSIGGCES